MLGYKCPDCGASYSSLKVVKLKNTLKPEEE